VSGYPLLINSCDELGADSKNHPKILARAKQRLLITFSLSVCELTFIDGLRFYDLYVLKWKFVEQTNQEKKYLAKSCSLAAQNFFERFVLLFLIVMARNYSAN